MEKFKLATKKAMFSEQLYDLILNLGDEWKVERIYANFKTEEVNVFIKYIDKEAEDPLTVACL